jgi:hypothetical protein
MKTSRTLPARAPWLCALLCASIGVCHAGVGGNTYTGNGGVVVIEFKPDGRAYVATGPISTPCRYTENGKTVTLVCEGDKTVFKVDDDGALIGPEGGLLGRLTLKK